MRGHRNILLAAVLAMSAAACSGSPAAQVSPATSTTSQAPTTSQPPTTSTLPATTTTVEATTTTVPLPDWTDLDGELEGAAPNASVLVAEVDDDECEPIHADNAQAQLSVGASAGLYLIGAVESAIEEGFFIGWDQPLALQNRLRSPQTGELYDLRDPGLVFTAQRLSQLLMGGGDTTAFDHLHDGLGRVRVEAAVATLGHAEAFRLHPFLSTREALALKFGDPARLLAYSAEPPDARVLVLDQLTVDVPSPETLDTWTEPIALDDVQWHASVTDLCRAMAWLIARPGPAAALAGSPIETLDPVTWPWTTAITGREPGAHNLTWLLERNDGRRFVISITLNDTSRPVDGDIPEQVAAQAATLLVDQP